MFLDLRQNQSRITNANMMIGSLSNVTEEWVINPTDKKQRKDDVQVATAEQRHSSGNHHEEVLLNLATLCTVVFKVGLQHKIREELFFCFFKVSNLHFPQI